MCTFIETSSFSKKIDSYPDSEEIKKEIEEELTNDPKSGDVIQGTGGIRKLRVSGLHSGKRGGRRLVYLYYEQAGKLFLLAIYDKNQKSDLTSNEKEVLKKLTDILLSEGER